MFGKNVRVLKTWYPNQAGHGLVGLFLKYLLLGTWIGTSEENVVFRDLKLLLLEDRDARRSVTLSYLLPHFLLMFFMKACN